MAEEKRQFPTEMVDLPSKGHFYPEGHPLSSGQVEIKYMTAKEEDILTSTNLINKGLVLDKLMEALIITDVNLDDILIGDKNAIMLASRVLAYGKDYTFEWVDESSGETKEESIDLTSLPDKEIDFSELKKGQNEFSFDLPTSNRKVTFRLLTHKDEKNIDAELKAMRKVTKGVGIDPEITTRLKSSIISVDGSSDRAFVNNFIDNEFLSMDSFAYRTHLTSITPDVELYHNVELDDGRVQEVAVPVTAQFFWPTSRR